MIHIVRGPEPQQVIDAREEHLSHAMLESGDDAPEEAEGYQVARPRLHIRQFAKCAYCESWTQEESQPVEHFRPRKRPSRIDWSALSKSTSGLYSTTDDDRFARGLPPLEFERVRWPDPNRQAQPERGYWWLAWTWENLVFGCVSCNGRKFTRFPLAKGSPVLGLHEAPPGGEQPLLLDPTDPSMNPMDVIRFRWDGKHWRPFPVNDDARAAWTIAVLGLDGTSLLALYRAKVKALDQMALSLKQALGGDAPEEVVRSEWSMLHECALAPEQDFLALAHDWLADTFAVAIERYGLHLPRPLLRHPDANGDAAPQPPLPHRPELDGLSMQLQYRVRRLRHYQARQDVLRALLVDLCRERPFTTDELKHLLGRPSALPAHLGALEGRALVRDAKTGRWSPARTT
ncbi:MAG TPA: hypothetical protein VLS89_02335 [Candidatus Nanopelagicales bacterium]|nr:hypothetical protein [Candidatus Nanopelagicales bacterium]